MYEVKLAYKVIVRGIIFRKARAVLVFLIAVYRKHGPVREAFVGDRIISKAILKKQLFEGQEYKEYVLTDEDKANIQKIRDEKFATWEWNYGESPESNFKNAERFKGGEVDVRMMLEDGKIQKIRFYGDFLSTDDLDALIRALEGQRYDIETVDKILSSMDLRPFFGAISKDEIMHVMFP